MIKNIFICFSFLAVTLARAELPTNFWQIAIQPFALKSSDGDGNNGPNAALVVSKSFFDSKLSLDLIPFIGRSTSGNGQGGFIGGLSFEIPSDKFLLKAGYFLGGFEGDSLMGPGASLDFISSTNCFAGVQYLVLSAQASSNMTTTPFHLTGIRIGKIF